MIHNTTPKLVNIKKSKSKTRQSDAITSPTSASQNDLVEVNPLQSSANADKTTRVSVSASKVAVTQSDGNDGDDDNDVDGVNRRHYTSSVTDSLRLGVASTSTGPATATRY